MSDNPKCTLCGYRADNAENPQVIVEALHNPDYFVIQCPNCGKLTFGIEAHTALNESRDREQAICNLSGLSSELSDMGDKLDLLNLTVQSALRSPLIPATPMEKVNKLLLWLYRNTRRFGQALTMTLKSKYVDKSTSVEGTKLHLGYTAKTYKNAVCYAINDDEFHSIVIAANEMGYINWNESASECTLTMSGHKYCKELLSNSPNTKRAFIAMWFCSDVDEADRDAISPAIIDCGFDPVRVDRKEHNNDITDEIIAGIKNSRFVVADLTGYRGGVYYEAGFALGLGKEVILTCRRDWFEGTGENPAVHFDVQHLNIIIWEQDKLAELRKRLVDRIRATIP